MESVQSLEFQSAKIAGLLGQMGAKFALIGGIAVSFRSIERTTKDIDLAVAVETDAEAENIVRRLSSSSYRVETVIEQDSANRLSTVRLVSLGEDEMFIDLLFASSGIEPEVVDTAEEIEIFPNLTLLVASRASLIALKVLSANTKSRLKDILDLQNLLNVTVPRELEVARELLNLITDRGFNRNKDLQKDLDGYIQQFSS